MRQRPGLRWPSGAFGCPQACGKLQRAGAVQDADAAAPFPRRAGAWLPRWPSEGAVSPAGSILGHHLSQMNTASGSGKAVPTLTHRTSMGDPPERCRRGSGGECGRGRAGVAPGRSGLAFVDFLGGNHAGFAFGPGRALLDPALDERYLGLGDAVPHGWHGFAFRVGQGEADVE